MYGQYIGPWHRGNHDTGSVNKKELSTVPQFAVHWCHYFSPVSTIVADNAAHHGEHNEDDKKAPTMSTVLIGRYPLGRQPEEEEEDDEATVLSTKTRKMWLIVYLLSMQQFL